MFFTVGVMTVHTGTTFRWIRFVPVVTVAVALVAPPPVEEAVCEPNTVGAAATARTPALFVAT